MIRSRVSRGVAVAGLLMVAASPAVAKSAISPDNGSYVWTGGSTEKTFYVKDNKSDNAAAYGNYTLTNRSGGRLSNNSGYGTIVSKVYDYRISAIRACTDLTLSPDSCSRWY